MSDSKDYEVKATHTRPAIYRANSSYLSISVTNSRIVNIDEVTGKILSTENSNESFDPDTLQRGMKSRHLQLIALSGAIGTGLFVGSGFTLSICGPAALFLSYIILSVVVYFVMTMLAAMSNFLPLPSTGAPSFVNDYTSESLGFAIGYNYWYAFSILVAAEVVAAAIVIEYWTTKVHIAVWITIFLVLLLVLNMSPVKYFGETEFYFGGIKLITLTGLIILGVVLFFGGGPNHDRLGFRYWKHGNAFHEHLVEGSTGRFLSVWTAIIKAGYSFICSPELIVAGAAEVVDPRRNIEKAASRFIYRLAFFYIFGSLVIGVIADSNSKQLLTGSGNASASPFVLGIQNAGISVLNHIINAVVLTSAASAGNSFLYSASRSLFSLSSRGIAPAIFKKTTKQGVPIYAVLISWAVGCLAYLNVSSSSANVFTWFSNISTISGFISWIFVAFAYIRWRKAIERHDLWDRVRYHAPLQPYGAYFCMIFISLLTITNGYAVFFDFNIGDFLAAYITIPIVLALYCGHRAYDYFFRGQKNWLVPLDEISFDGLDLVEEEERNTAPRVPRNWLERIWFWIA